jgi:hypothetical protein
MNRREALKSGSMALLFGLFGIKPKQDEVEFVPVMRWDFKRETWRYSKFQELRPGMVCVIGDGEG